MRVLLCLLFTASSAIAAPDASVFDQKPKKTRKINRIEYVAQDGRSVSFGGYALKWTGEGDCSQNEGMEPIISVQGDGVTVRNAYLVETPDGIHVSGKNVIIENMIFPKVCEDAITANGADNLIIRNCAFRGAKDKVIQLNGGKNILIENCYFENCSKPVRVKKGVTVTVRNNVSRNTTAFVMADGKDAHAIVENNDVKESEWFVKAQKGAVVEVGDNKTSKIEKPNEVTDGGVLRTR
jgi:pectate lyase